MNLSCQNGYNLEIMLNTYLKEWLVCNVDLLVNRSMFQGKNAVFYQSFSFETPHMGHSVSEVSVFLCFYWPMRHSVDSSIIHV